MSIGQNVRRLRQAKGVTQWQLSQAVGISPGRMLLIERGDKDVSKELLVAFAKALGVSVEAINK